MSDSSNQIIEGLWNEQVDPNNYGSQEQYNKHLFEQYKLYVEMADRVSARRGLANTFFLTLNTLLITAAGFVYENGPSTSIPWFNVFPLLAVLALCYVWWRLIKSYRQLNTAKFKVIGEYERRLPSSPYWSAEWKALGEGKNNELYQPLTDIENYIPLIFALLYLMGLVAVLLL